MSRNCYRYFVEQPLVSFNFSPTNLTFSKLDYVYKHTKYSSMSRVCMHAIQEEQIEWNSKTDQIKASTIIEN